MFIHTDKYVIIEGHKALQMTDDELGCLLQAFICMDSHLDGPTANTLATNWIKKILGRWFHPQVQKRGISFGGEGLVEGVTALAAVLLRAAS